MKESKAETKDFLRILAWEAWRARLTIRLPSGVVYRPTKKGWEKTHDELL